MSENSVLEYIEHENTDEEIELCVYYDYNDAEKANSTYPGCDAEVEINEVVINGTEVEVCLMPDFEESVMENILEKENSYKPYKAYGYMLRR
jgi:hypothetical protein